MWEKFKLEGHTVYEQEWQLGRHGTTEDAVRMGFRALYVTDETKKTTWLVISAAATCRPKDVLEIHRIDPSEAVDFAAQAYRNYVADMLAACRSWWEEMRFNGKWVEHLRSLRIDFDPSLIHERSR